MDILTSLADGDLDTGDIGQDVDDIDKVVHLVVDATKLVKGGQNFFKASQQENGEETVVKEMEIEEKSSSFFPSKDGLQNPQLLFEPIKVKEAEDEGHCKLNFKPPPIQTWFLVSSLVFFLACIAAISALIRHGSQTAHTFHIHESRNYLAFRYVPGATGTLTVILWQAIVTSLARMTPYISLAEQSEGASKNNHLRTALGNIQSSHVLTSNLYSVAAEGYWLLFSSMLARHILVVIVPLKASFLQIVADDTVTTGWTIYVLPKVGYILITMHSILLVVTICILARLWDCNTGVKWDPVSIADQLALVQCSNVLEMYKGLEFATQNQCAAELKIRGHESAL
jgi:hypothetical protein